MALPRTHDGSVGPRSASSTLPVLTAVLAVVAVVCAVVLGTRFADTTGSFGSRVEQVFSGPAAAQETTADNSRERELVMSQANQFMIRINSYGPSDLDAENTMPGYVERVSEVITPKFDVEFREQVTLAEQSVSEAGLARSVNLYATGTESLEADLATVLVTGEILQSYPDPAPDATEEDRIEFEPSLFRIEVRLVKIEGTWLVDDFAPVTGEVPGEPTPGAPGEPTAPATVEPSGGASGLVGRYAEVVANRRVSIDEAAAALAACGFPQPASAGDETCASAPQALGDAARGLAASLRGAANPDAKVFVGVPPEAIADLVEVTGTAADNAVAVFGALSPACATDTGQACGRQRTAASQAVDNLVTAIDAWEAVS